MIREFFNRIGHEATFTDVSRVFLPNVRVGRAIRQQAAKSGTSSSEIRRNKAAIQDVERAETNHRGWPGASRRFDRFAYAGHTQLVD